MTQDAKALSSRASSSVATELLARPADENHIVQFYESEDFLCETVAHFLGAGLAADEPLIVIAATDRCEKFARRLQLRGFDVAGARASGQLTLLDARATLAKFMVDGMPDWQRFKAAIGGVIAKSREGRDGRVRAYGEMVDILWREGNPQAAIALEELWNDIAKIHSFSLLCAYVMGNFYKEADGEHFHEVCRQHTHVIPTESFSNIETPDDRLREIGLLQQRARALESEVAHRKELEKSLREALAARRRSDETLRDFVENAVYGLHWVGADGIIEWANKAEMELLGYVRHEYIGHHISEFHADPEVIEDMLARLTRNETLHDYEARLRCKDGSIKVVLIGSNVLWEDGKFIHTRCFTRDITEKKKAEEAKRQSDSQLEASLVREKEARQEAERTVRFNEMFAGILGHDLRNPLSAISTGAHYLLRMNAGEKVARTATRILSSTDRMTRMVDQLLDFTRIRVGDGIALRRERVDLRDLCRRVAEELEAGHPERVVRVECEGEAIGEWDADRLLQVFSNLAGNALHHGVIDTPVDIRIDATGPSEVVALVHNAGVVPSDMLPVLFEPFRGAYRQQKPKGLGLGLFITQQILLSHGGTIEVTSTESDGTTVRVRLPRTDVAPRSGR
ncbi:MAG: sensor protein [Myxococcales bacterium]|nr:sensor protein [Myxococcales bacterium]